MDIHLDNSGPFVIATMTGDFTMGGAEEFAQTLHEHACGDGAALAIDMSGVTSVDSSGLSALVSLVTRSRLCRGRVLVVAPSSFVSSILGVTRLDQWLEICGSMDEAERRFTVT